MKTRAEIDALIANTKERLGWTRDLVRPQWDDATVEQLVGIIEELLFEFVDGGGCVCNGGPQGEGLVSIEHEPHCPLFVGLADLLKPSTR